MDGIRLLRSIVGGYLPTCSSIDVLPAHRTCTTGGSGKSLYNSHGCSTWAPAVRTAFMTDASHNLKASARQWWRPDMLESLLTTCQPDLDGPFRSATVQAVRRRRANNDGGAPWCRRTQAPAEQSRQLCSCKFVDRWHHIFDADGLVMKNVITLIGFTRRSADRDGHPGIRPTCHR